MDSTTAAGAGLTVVIVLLLMAAISGLITGALARLVLPGPDPMSWPKTILYGIGGSLLGGIVWQLVTRVMPLPQFTNFIFGVGGAAALIWFFRRRKAG